MSQKFVRVGGRLEIKFSDQLWPELSLCKAEQYREYCHRQVVLHCPRLWPRGPNVFVITSRQFKHGKSGWQHHELEIDICALGVLCPV